MEIVFQGLIDRTRAALDLKTVTTIFGYKHRPNTRERTQARTPFASRDRETYV